MALVIVERENGLPVSIDTDDLNDKHYAEYCRLIKTEVNTRLAHLYLIAHHRED